MSKPVQGAPEAERNPGPPGVQRREASPASCVAQGQAAEAERDRLIDELRRAQDQLRADLDAMTRLHELGSLFVREGNLAPVLEQILDAAIAISGADFGNIQLLDPQSSDLKIVAQRGFPGWWLEFWNGVSRGHGVCGTALERGARVIVEDVERSPIFLGTPALEVQRRAGVRAVQSTPLVSRSGRVLGMFSTHWRKPGRPDERSLRLLDLLARHAADIAERAQGEEALRESEERFRLLVQGVKDCAIYMLAPDGTVTSWSRAAEQLFGYHEAEILGRHRGVLFTEAQRAAGLPQRDLEEALATGRSEQEAWRVRKDGTRFWANVLVTAFRDDRGRLRGLGNITRDFTDRKRAETALRESEERLRASEAVLREADRQKDRFLATLSHELRNPLAPIRNSLYILDRATPGSEQAKRAQTIIKRQIGHMTWLIDDLLDVTRIANGKIKLERERLDLNQLAHKAVEDHRVVFARSDVRLELLPAPAEVWVDGDRVRLAQIISNLLQNAVKFTPHGGKTTISIESNPSQGQATLTVRDTGNGIQPEMLPRLFHAFSQAEAPLRHQGGLGLGLALVKGLAEMHGGSASAASDGPGKGATFTITLPLDVTTARTTPAGPGLGATAAPRRVLVIDDNEDAANTLREVLQLDGHLVEVAYTGREGLEKARAFRADVVLCGIGLPGMDGYEVARTMRADPGLRGVGLVALSGYAQPEDVEMAREAGFDAHLAKPPSIDALERVLVEVESRNGPGVERP
jgi:PAS domain S-box-containing protein